MIRMLSAFGLVIWLLVFTPPALAARPTVVSTEPVHGDAAVDPDTRRIVVRFDQPMDTRGGWSIVGGGETFPELRGRPRWADPRTLVIGVRLKPNQAYRMSFNNERFQNFRSKRNEVLVPYPLQFRTAGGDTQDANPTDDGGPFGRAEAEAMTRELRTLIAESYSHRDRVVTDWDALFAKNAEALHGASSPAEFAGTASILLAAARDKHVWLDVDGTGFNTYVDGPVGNYDHAVRSTVVPDYLRHNPYLATGRFADGTLYAAIDSVGGRTDGVFEGFFTMLGQHGPDAPGLIIDLRANGGGNESLAALLAGCFIEEPVVYATSLIVEPTEADGFAGPWDRTLQRNWARPTYRGPVAVLTGRQTMSSAEGFTLMLRALPNSRSFGSATQGSSGNPKPHDLGHGVTVFLSSWRSLTPEGEAFEGIGLEPDEPVRFVPGTGRDAVIDAALAWLQQRADR